MRMSICALIILAIAIPMANAKTSEVKCYKKLTGDVVCVDKETGKEWKRHEKLTDEVIYVSPDGDRVTTSKGEDFLKKRKIEVERTNPTGREKK